MSQYLDNSVPEYFPAVPDTINGVLFNPALCPLVDDVGSDGGPHYCVHDWRTYWGNQKQIPGVA